jgi:predicted O-methyltransferase YrrM
MPDLAIIVPTRGRPENIRKVISAWDFTNAWDQADLVLVADTDDPEIQGYRDVVAETEHPDTHQPLVTLVEVSEWMPMVHKLNQVAITLAKPGAGYFAVGFAGDDHFPQTIGWTKRYLTVLRELGTGMVYGDDGYQGRKLSTEWAITSDVIRALGRMVPAPVDHMYCDNSMMDLFNGAGALRHLPEVRIEHRHPIAGKAETDDQYKRVNSRDQFRTDRTVYESWRRSGMVTDINKVRALRAPNAEAFRVEPVRPVATRPSTPRTRGQVRRSGPTQRKAEMARFPFSKEFKEVRGATPDEIGMTLADFASVVPADQEIVELGVFQGRTALIMAWGAKQGHGAHVTGIDPWDLPGNVYDPPFTDEQSKAWAHYRIRELGYSDKINLVQAFSHEVAEHWGSRTDDGENPKKVGLLYVDGDHTKEGARRDIEAWAPHLAEGAVVAIDDYGHPDWPGVGQAVDELVAEGFLAPIDLYHDRLAVTHLVIGEGRTKAITSEGANPAPYIVNTPLPEEDWMTDPEPAVDRAGLEAEWRRVDPEGVAALEQSAEELTRRGQVQPGELEDPAAGTPIEDLNLVQLKTLAKHRGIVLGARKDKKELILQALRAGE